MAKTNLLPQLTNWKKSYQNTDLDNITITEDGYGCTFTITSESSYLYCNIDPNKFKGHTVKLELADFTASDDEGWIQVRLYDSEISEATSIDIFTKEIALPFEMSIDVPADCGRVQIRLRHQWDSDGIDPPSTITVAGMLMYDTYTESQYTLNFHKVLAENLPNSVTPGTQHIYFTTDGSTVNMYISTLEGGLIPVGCATGGGSNSADEYYNAYTQQYIDERKSEIIELTKLGKCFVFAVVTDIHVRVEDGTAGRYNQVKDLIMVTNQLPIDYICCTGDIMSYCQDWDGNVEPRLEAVKDIFSQCKIPWFATRGNHDYNSDDYNSSDNPNIVPFDYTKSFISNRDWAKSMITKLKHFPQLEYHFNANDPMGGYFYVEDVLTKVRLIFLNSENTHETETGRAYVNASGEVDYSINGIKTKLQVEWLVNEALDMTGKTDYFVGLFSHTALYTDMGTGDVSEFHGYGSDSPEIRSILKAFQNGEAVNLSLSVCDTTTHIWQNMSVNKDFSSQGPIKIFGAYAGHTHDDCYKKVDGLDIFVSTCTCSTRRDSWSTDPEPTKLPPDRNNTNLAMSMNVFIVNETTRTVYVIKIGSKRDNSIKTSSDYSFQF